MLVAAKISKKRYRALLASFEAGIGRSEHELSGNSSVSGANSGLIGGLCGNQFESQLMTISAARGWACINMRWKIEARVLTLILSLCVVIAGSVMAFFGSLWYQKKAQTGFFGALTSFFLRLPFSPFSDAVWLSGYSFFTVLDLAKNRVSMSLHEIQPSWLGVSSRNKSQQAMEG